MRCLVTAGPTFENVDRVRRLTNFSTGTLGTLLAEALESAGHDVTLLRGRMATAPLPRSGVRVREFTTACDLAARFLEHSGPDPVALFHAAAVSDFCVSQIRAGGPSGTFRPAVSGKLSTRSGPLWVELRPTPKLLAGLREWYPRALLVGWKYEVEGPRSATLELGREQLRQCGTDLCVVNGPGFGPGFGLLEPGGGDPELIEDSAALTGRLVRWIQGRDPV